MTTDAQQALAHVREALAAGPTPGPWVTMPANAGVHCVARINAWEAVPPSDCELSHDSIDASFIAACSPANMTAILAHVEAQAAEIERLQVGIELIETENADLLTRLDLESGTVGMIARECADLRRQLDECSQMLARQAATIGDLTRPAEEA